MPNRLTENLDSDFIERLNALRPRNAYIDVKVYVEGYDDVVFWHDILKEYGQQKNIKFDITPHSKADDLTKGKSAVLEHVDGVGQNLILCVDSDYDYLLNGHTSESTIINENQYIFQTYAYSIENLKCYRESLHDVCGRTTTNFSEKINLSELIKWYSNIIYPLLLWSLYFASKSDTTTFTISDFSNHIKVSENPDISNQCVATIGHVQQEVQTKITQLEQTHSTDIQQVQILSQQLRPLGLNEDTAYFFIQGHTLFDYVVLRILRKLVEILRKEKEDEIRINAQHSSEILNHINQYNNKCKNLEDVLTANTNFKDCYLYQKIKQDLDLYIQNFN